MLKILGLTITGVLLSVTLKKYNPEQGLLVSLAATSALAFIICMLLSPVVAYAVELFGATGLDAAIFTPLLKCVGISVIARLAAELCRDAKENSIAAAVELGAAAMIIVSAMPLFVAVLNLLKGLL
ncbi:hypothetical protein FACS1894217_06000 [Clostridia bacterium]|nr:hypothetical protein FACS1894217_06000 [Clostridia bacterium]